MKKVLITMITFCLVLIPFAIYAESGQPGSSPPPIAPPLVREGEFAVKLAGSLNIGQAQNEAEAESMLSAVGIAPRNGWISDYPVTPDILAEVQNATGEAADSKKLAIGRDEALRALRTSALELEIPIIAEIPGGYAEGPPPTAPQYIDPSMVDNYYYEEGPPVFTYYPPPWDYNYLYAWVPFPFWYSGFFFPGFFVLNDFDRVVFAHGHRFSVSNHFFDRGHHRFSRIDPGRRWGGARTSSGAFAGRSVGKGFGTGDARRGAESILRRSDERMRASGGMSGRNLGTLRGQTSPSFSGRTDGRFQIGSRQNFRGTPGSSGRSFNSPGGGRSFSSSMGNAGRSFSPPSTGLRGGSGGFHAAAGSFSGGNFHGGGFSHGASFGGFHGGGFSHSGGFSHGGGFGGHR